MFVSDSSVSRQVSAYLDCSGHRFAGNYAESAVAWITDVEDTSEPSSKSPELTNPRAQARVPIRNNLTVRLSTTGREGLKGLLAQGQDGGNLGNWLFEQPPQQGLIVRPSFL